MRTRMIDKHTEEWRVQYRKYSKTTAGVEIHNVMYINDIDEAKIRYMKWLMEQALEVSHVTLVKLEQRAQGKYETVFKSEFFGYNLI